MCTQCSHNDDFQVATAIFARFTLVISSKLSLLLTIGENTLRTSIYAEPVARNVRESRWAALWYGLFVALAPSVWQGQLGLASLWPADPRRRRASGATPRPCATVRNRRAGTERCEPELCSPGDGGSGEPLDRPS